MAYFQGLLLLVSGRVTPERLVMVGDLGIGIGAKVLTALFLQVHDLRISRMALRTPGDDDVPKKGGE